MAHTMWTTTGTGMVTNRSLAGVTAGSLLSSASRIAAGQHRDQAEQDQSGGYPPRVPGHRFSPHVVLRRACWPGAVGTSALRPSRARPIGRSGNPARAPGRSPLDGHPHPDGDPMNPLVCPKCGSDMRAYERNGVTIDQCTGCRGIFLDRGELEKLTDAEASYYGSRQAPAAGTGARTRPLPGRPVPRRPVPGRRPRRLLQEEEEAQLPGRPVRLTSGRADPRVRPSRQGGRMDVRAAVEARVESGEVHGAAWLVDRAGDVSSGAAGHQRRGLALPHLVGDQAGGRDARDGPGRRRAAAPGRPGRRAAAGAGRPPRAADPRRPDRRHRPRRPPDHRAGRARVPARSRHGLRRPVPRHGARRARGAGPARRTARTAGVPGARRVDADRRERARSPTSPATAWLYNTGAQVLGVLVARAAGRPLPELLAGRGCSTRWA